MVGPIPKVSATRIVHRVQETASHRIRSTLTLANVFFLGGGHALSHEFGATVEEVTTLEEHVSFPLPRELRNLQTSFAGRHNLRTRSDVTGRDLKAIIQ